MRKKIRHYHQSSNKTCGPACILMLLDYYGIITYPKRAMEWEIYNAYKIEEYPGMNGAALARHLARHGLAVTIYHSAENGLDNEDGYFKENEYQALLAAYQEQLDKAKGKVRTIRTQDISCDFLKEKLKEGFKIILECFVDGDADGIHEKVLHWVLVYGYEEGTFRVHNSSADQRMMISDEDMEEYMETPIGRMAVVVGKAGEVNI